MKSNLKSALKKSGTNAARIRESAGDVSEPVHVSESVPVPAARRGSDSRPHRAGTRMLSAHVPPEMYTAVRMIAASQGVTMQAVVKEAFDDFLAKHGRN